MLVVSTAILAVMDQYIFRAYASKASMLCRGAWFNFYNDRGWPAMTISFASARKEQNKVKIPSRVEDTGGKKKKKTIKRTIAWVVFWMRWADVVLG